ncbi:MAG TPA: hypothetical protein VK087_03100 [Tissierellaceae bacterium]|nr:hypothetical protein [Tissierellaceae bacterium]
MKGKLMLILGLVLVLSITACSTDEPIDDEDTPPIENREDLEEEEEKKEEESETTSEDPEKFSDEWPEDFMPEAPKLAGDIVRSKEEGPHKYFLEFKDISHDDASDYVDSIKEAGFTENTNEYIDTNSIKYKGMDKDNNLLILYWDKSEIVKLELIKKDN